MLKKIPNYSEINSSNLWYSLFSRGSHEDTDWGFFPLFALDLEILDSDLISCDWCVLSGAGKRLGLLLTFALLKTFVLFSRTLKLKMNERKIILKLVSCLFSRLLVMMLLLFANGPMFLVHCLNVELLVCVFLGSCGCFLMVADNVILILALEVGKRAPDIYSFPFHSSS